MTQPRIRPNRRRSLASGALAMAAVLAAGPALAAARCATEADQVVFEVEALKTELMVVATTCKAEDRYNAFVQRYQPQLAANGRAFGQYFTRTHGRNGQRLNDAYITNLANARSTEAHELGSDFCPRNQGLFDEVMALSGPADLPGYAAGKNLLNDGVTACEGAPAAASAATPARRAAAAPARNRSR